MVLGVNREVVLLRVLGDAARQRPRDEHPVALQPKVPVQPPGVMLLDYEAGVIALAAVAISGRLRAAFEGSLQAVSIELARRGLRLFIGAYDWPGGVPP